MKIRILDRIVGFLAGLLVTAAAVLLVMETFFGYAFTSMLHAVSAEGNLQQKILMVDVALVLLVIGLYCVSMLFRRRKKSETFVVQQGEGGELAISIKTLENLVKKVISQHDELEVSAINLTNTKNGLIIRMRGSMATGVNIPLTVSGLQRQIKQYVTSCSGVDVKEVRMQVETSAAQTRREEKVMKRGERTTHVETIKPPKAAAVKEMPVAEKVDEEAATAKKRPFHQRVFGRGEEQVTVPAPAPVQEHVSEPVKEVIPEPVSEPVAETPVVEAIETAVEEMTAEPVAEPVEEAIEKTVETVAEEAETYTYEAAAEAEATVETAAEVEEPSLEQRIAASPVIAPWAAFGAQEGSDEN